MDRKDRKDGQNAMKRDKTAQNLKPAEKSAGQAAAGSAKPAAKNASKRRRRPARDRGDAAAREADGQRRFCELLRAASGTAAERASGAVAAALFEKLQSRALDDESKRKALEDLLALPPVCRTAAWWAAASLAASALTKDPRDRRISDAELELALVVAAEQACGAASFDLAPLGSVMHARQLAAIMRCRPPLPDFIRLPLALAPAWFAALEEAVGPILGWFVHPWGFRFLVLEEKKTGGWLFCTTSLWQSATKSGAAVCELVMHAAGEGVFEEGVPTPEAVSLLAEMYACATQALKKGGDPFHLPISRFDGLNIVPEWPFSSEEANDPEESSLPPIEAEGLDGGVMRILFSEMEFFTRDEEKAIEDFGPGALHSHGREQFFFVMNPGREPAFPAPKVLGREAPKSKAKGGRKRRGKAAAAEGPKAPALKLAPEGYGGRLCFADRRIAEAGAAILAVVPAMMEGREPTFLLRAEDPRTTESFDRIPNPYDDAAVTMEEACRFDPALRFAIELGCRSPLVRDKDGQFVELEAAGEAPASEGTLLN